MWMCLLYTDVIDHTSLLDCYMLTIRITLEQTVPPHQGNLYPPHIQTFKAEDYMLPQRVNMSVADELALMTHLCKPYTLPCAK